MSATGLDVFDKTVQTTNIWLNEINEEIGPDRKLAWHVLGTVLRALRDHIPAPLGAHLAAELPLPVNPQTAVTAVFGVLSHHLPAGQVEKARQALPKEIRPLWPDVRAAAQWPREEKPESRARP